MAQVYVSLGTNVDRDKNLVSGLDALADVFGRLSLSSLFESEAVGFAGSAFYNIVIGFSSDLSLGDLHQTLRNIEYQHGRTLDAAKFSPRSLDLDILLYGNQVTIEPIELPRAEITENAFVLWPLSELIPDDIHPLTNKSYAQLWHEFDHHSQKLEMKPLNWQQQ